MTLARNGATQRRGLLKALGRRFGKEPDQSNDLSVKKLNYAEQKVGDGHYFFDFALPAWTTELR